MLNSGADTLVLNHYGGNMVNSLSNAIQFDLLSKQVNGKDFKIVVPLYSELMAAGAGENIKGVFGSITNIVLSTVFIFIIFDQFVPHCLGIVFSLTALLYRRERL